jgi:uncharacterized FlgJ-related protein
MKFIKVYYFSPKELTFKPFMLHPLIVLILGILVSFLFGFTLRKEKNNNIEYETLVLMLKESEKERFSGEELYNYLKNINVKFPDIVYAQALLETGNFQSKIFRTNNNLFGMKEAKRRPTLAKGTELNHAFYDSWKESVHDYVFFASTYLNNIKTKENYYEYLGANYAEDPEYVNKLKKIVESVNIDTNQLLANK